MRNLYSAQQKIALPSYIAPLLITPYHQTLCSFMRTVHPSHHDRPSTLSIDKVSMVRYDPSPANAVMTCDRLVESHENNQFPGSVLRGGRRYHIQYVIPVSDRDPREDRLLIQAGPRFPGIPDFRFEFNPAILGKVGVGHVLDILNTMFPEGSISLLRNSIVTRVDLALDLHGLSADKVIVRSLRQRKHGIFSNKHGIPETLYLGAHKSNQTVVYDKDHDNGSVLRIERRLHPRRCGHELPSISDPFSVVQMVPTDALLPFLDGIVPEHFFDFIRVRGFSHALATLQPATRKNIKAIIKDPGTSGLPSTADIWSRWPELLNTSGLGLLLENVAEDVTTVDSVKIRCADFGEWKPSATTCE